MVVCNLFDHNDALKNDAFMRVDRIRIDLNVIRVTHIVLNINNNIKNIINNRITGNISRRSIDKYSCVVNKSFAMVCDVMPTFALACNIVM